MSNKINNINFYQKFTNYGFDSYLRVFQDYKNLYPTHYANNLLKLKNILDADSIHNVEFFLNLVLSLPLPSEDFLVKASKIQDAKYAKAIADEKLFFETTWKYSSIYKLQGYEKFELNVFKYHCGLKFLPKIDYRGKIAIDVGAFWGDSALILSKYNVDKIICFEPNKVNYDLLKQTMQNNNISNWIINNMGAYYKDSKEIMYYISNNQNHGASIKFKPRKHCKSQDVDLVSLDNYIAKNNIKSNLGILKIDAEGAGLEVVYGAKKLIKDNKPTISCAIYHNPLELFKIPILLLKINPEYKIKIVNLNNNFLLKELTLLAY
jgi:FkbM family methyltransferase